MATKCKYVMPQKNIRKNKINNAQVEKSNVTAINWIKPNNNKKMFVVPKIDSETLPTQLRKGLMQGRKLINTNVCYCNSILDSKTRTNLWKGITWLQVRK